MPQNSLHIDCVAPRGVDFERVFSAKAMPPFSDEILVFLQGLSDWLMQDPEAKSHPDVVSFGFWCRKRALLSMRAEHGGNLLRLGRGVVFHVAPSNVPVNFAYSLAVGLLAGNANIVRIPSREFPQVDVICRGVRELLARPEFAALADHMALVRYERDDAVTSFFSGHCDVRVIWGGDQAIADIRRSLLPPRSFDLTFADRYSFCVINADRFVDEADPAKVAQGFYNDTYLFDQNACTAPHLVLWLGSGENVAAAKELFWSSLHAVVAQKYQLQAVSAVDKLSDAYRFAALSGECRLSTMNDNLILRIELERLDKGLDEARSTCGYFYEYHAKRLEEVLPLISRKFQTVALYGMELSQLREFVAAHRPCGIDRIVPIGRTTDFSLVWDGYDLITMLSRSISFPPERKS